MDSVTGQTFAVSGKHDKNQGKAQRKGTREVNWSDGETSMLLDLLAEVQIRKQNPNGDGGYNDLEWSYIYTEFTKKNTHKRGLLSLKLRWKNLKCDFSFFRYMANRSGCSWNEDAHIPDILEVAWTDLKEKDLNRYKKYVNKTFPWYKRVEALYGKGITSGRSNITTDKNSSIPRSFAEYSSSDEDNSMAQQEVDEFKIHNFQEMADRVEPVSEQVDLMSNETDFEPVPVDIPTAAPVIIPSSQNRKRVMHQVIIAKFNLQLL